MANDGGPAFPVHPEIELAPEDFYGGMRLRDYFAAAALQGRALAFRSGVSHGTELNIPIIAEWCYKVADAMLAARDSAIEPSG